MSHDKLHKAEHATGGDDALTAADIGADAAGAAATAVDVAESYSDAALGTHAGAADPHAGYQKESEKDQVSGYPGLDASGFILASKLPAPSSSTLGGVKSKAAVSHQFLTSIGTDGVPVLAQPAASDVSGLAAIATSGSAADLASGTVSAARLPDRAIVPDALAKTGTIREAFTRDRPLANLALVATGRLLLTRVYYLAGDVVSNILWWNGTTAESGGSHCWYSLWNSSLQICATTTDQTGATFMLTANTEYSIAIAKVYATPGTLGSIASASTYTIPTSGNYYHGIVVVGTVPSQIAYATIGNFNSGVIPRLSAGCDSSLTDPASVPGTATVSQSLTGVPYSRST